MNQGLSRSKNSFICPRIISISRVRASKLAQAIAMARRTLRIANQNIVFALGVKGIFLLMGVLGKANMWEATFADVGVSVIAILNATRALKTGK